MKHLFLTGPKGVGKSTVLRRYLALRQAAAGGFCTVWVGESLHLLPYGADITRCTLENRVAQRATGGCHPYPAIFDTLGPGLLRGDWIAMDELGFLESDSAAFQAAVLAALDGGAAVAGVIKPQHTPFLDAVRAHANIAVVAVTPDNRDSLPAQLLEEY